MRSWRAGVRASIRQRSDSLTGLWSDDSSMQRPRRHSTARLSPRLATKTRRPSSSATTAVVPHANASPPDRSASSVACRPARCAWRAVKRQRWRVARRGVAPPPGAAEAAAETLTRHGRAAPKRPLRPRCARGRAGVAALAPPGVRAGAHRRAPWLPGCRQGILGGRLCFAAGALARTAQRRGRRGRRTPAPPARAQRLTRHASGGAAGQHRQMPTHRVEAAGLVAAAELRHVIQRHARVLQVAPAANLLRQTSADTGPVPQLQKATHALLSAGEAAGGARTRSAETRA